MSLTLLRIINVLTTAHLHYCTSSPDDKLSDLKHVGILKTNMVLVKLEYSCRMHRAAKAQREVLYYTCLATCNTLLQQAHFDVFICCHLQH
jgi:hypothetical protein